MEELLRELEECSILVNNDNKIIELEEEIIELEEEIVMKDIKIKHLQVEVTKLKLMLNHKNGVEEPETMRGYNSRISEEKEEFIVTKYKANKSISLIVREEEVARNTVYKVLRRNGIQI